MAKMQRAWGTPSGEGETARNSHSDSEPGDLSNRCKSTSAKCLLCWVATPLQAVPSPRLFHPGQTSPQKSPVLNQQTPFLSLSFLFKGLKPLPPGDIQTPQLDAVLRRMAPSSKSPTPLPHLASASAFSQFKTCAPCRFQLVAAVSTTTQPPSPPSLATILLCVLLHLDCPGCFGSLPFSPWARTAASWAWRIS